MKSKMLCAMSLPVWLASSQLLAQDAADETLLQEVIVTANRRAESASKVPVSISAFSQEQMDVQGLKEIDDLVRYTPGLRLTRAGNGSNQISIRGISSGAGAGTTGVYIDDTPIQVRNLAYAAGTTFPALFDLERVEVLRGPQGTLFGAGSEGGTVRFIQTSPGLSDYSVYARGELSTTEGGDLSYEAGGAFGGPIIEGKLGFRASAFYRKEGGYVDGITGTPVVLDPTGNAGGAGSLTFTNRQVVRENTNSSEVTGFRGALKLAATDTLDVTASVTYQRTQQNDGFGTFWPGASTGSSGYARPVYSAGNAATNPVLNSLNAPDKDEGEDEFYLPALTVNWNLGPVQLVSNTSYFDRHSDQWTDFTGYYLWFYNVAPDPRPGDKAASLYENGQYNFTQEVRLQSADDDARITWVAGLFYSDNKQRGRQDIRVNFLENAPRVGAFFLPFAGEPDGPPFGPGASAFENYFGVPAIEGGSLWSIDFQAQDRQTAAFAQTEFKITGALKLTTGLRFSRNKLDFAADYASPENNQNAPSGLPGPVLPPLYSTAALNSAEDSWTPKVGLSYEINETNMIYTTAAKGFRPAGASQQVPITCNQDLIDFGYVDSNGNPTQPLKYTSDTVWSYEVGTKNRLFGNKLVMDASAYYIKWKDIQTNLFLPTCAESFTNNIAEATSEGFDLSVQVNPISGLLLSGTIGYNRSQFGANGTSPTGVLVVREDAYVPGAPPPWVYSISGQYDFSMPGGRGFYVRTDVTHSTEERRIGATDPGSTNYNPQLRPVSGYSIVNARLGTMIGGADVALFVDNVTNEDTSLALANRSALNGAKRYVWTDSVPRPRTVGVFVSYRY